MSGDQELPVLVETDTKKIIHFVKSEFMIGRTAGYDLDIQSIHVSRRQCIIKQFQQQWMIKNLSTYPHTLLNGNVVQDWTELHNDDTIKFLYYDKSYKFFESEEKMLYRQAKKRRLNENSQEAVDNKNNFEETCQSLTLKLNSTTEKLAQMTESYDKIKSELTSAKKTNKDLLENVVNLEVSRNELMGSYTEALNTLQEAKEEVGRVISDLNEVKSKQAKSKEAPKISTGGKVDSLFMSIELSSVALQLDAQREKLRLAEQTIAEKEAKSEQMFMAFEQEFSCCVCSDIMINATILNCKHTFCKSCLDNWKKNKKECPQCRTKIKQETQNLIVNSFVDRIGPLLGESYVEKRAETIRERQNSVIQAPSTRGGRSRGRISIVFSNSGTDTVALEYSTNVNAHIAFPDLIDLTSPIRFSARRTNSRGGRPRRATSSRSNN